jgi:general secretion pathway protein G
MLKIFSKRALGFTLIQLLIIIVVVVVLAAVAAPRLLRQQERARRTEANNDLDTLGLALDIYANQNGTYPSTEQGLKALWEKPIIPPVPTSWSGPYGDLDKPILEDPWGNDYVYIYPGRRNKYDYDLVSYAKDGISGGSGDNEDIVNWTEED